jgi:ADP-glucose pyrophosphorylase
VFKKSVLSDLLDSTKTESKFLDFGGEIIPYAATHGLRVQARHGAARRAGRGAGA